MTLISLFIHFFYEEVYSDEKAEKVIYLREAVADEGESQLHVYASMRALPNGAYTYFNKTFAHELKITMSSPMFNYYFELLS